MNSISISERMRAIGSMVLPGEPVADIGTDHGFVPADLLLRGVVPFAIMTDINPGPLEKCRANMQALGLDPSLYELRLGSGFEPVRDGEAPTAVIAGMGGELIEQIIVDCRNGSTTGTLPVRRLVLQPRTHADDLRVYLTCNGFRIIDYVLAKERGRICEVFAAEPAEAAEEADGTSAGPHDPDCGIISRFLLDKGDPLLAEFVDYKINRARAVLRQLANSGRTESTEAVGRWYDRLNELLDIRRRI